ncbi:MAG: hypothetical protein KGJ07_01875 [Patescibacteria group bacterium]|nr:hypothetical protein [Patescibacteria group bacterium]MDE2590188.1 hypothetical protein [Patescibacteria group bacterium]
MIPPSHAELPSDGNPVSSQKRSPFPPVFDDPNGTLMLRQNKILRQVSPYITPAGHPGLYERLTATSDSDSSMFTAYPININTQGGRRVMRALMREIATGRMQVPGDHRRWNKRVRRAVEAAQAIQKSHSSDSHEFTLDGYGEYQRWADRKRSPKSPRR